MNKDLIVFDVRGALGDELCNEPIIRYAIKNAPGKDIRVLCGHKKVFEHLNIPLGLEEPEINVKGPHLRLFASPYVNSPQGVSSHPFATYATPILVHPVDFHSLFMLRRMIPDVDKRIFIPIKADALESLRSKVPFKLEDAVAVHLSSKQQVRTFPNDYAQALIDRLSLSFPVIVYGQTEKCFANTFSNERVCNLLDKLSYYEFTALHAKAHLVITNDSSPVHVASAFDNALIVLPTLRHPDRLMHIRNGSRYWKAAALYKKLLLDDLQESPFYEEVYKDWGQCADKLHEFLPDIDYIFKVAYHLYHEDILIGGINI